MNPNDIFNPKAAQQQLHPNRVYLDPRWMFSTNPKSSEVARMMEDGGATFCIIDRNETGSYDLYLCADDLIIYDFETFGDAEYTAREYWFAYPNSWFDATEDAAEIELLKLPADELLALLNDEDLEHPLCLAPWIETMLEGCDEG